MKKLILTIVLILLSTITYSQGLSNLELTQNSFNKNQNSKKNSFG